MGVIDETQKPQGKVTVTPTAASAMAGVAGGTLAYVAGGVTLGPAVLVGAGVAWLTKKILG